MQILILLIFISIPNLLFASTDGIYGLNKNITSSWDGTNASLIAATSGDYDFAYGDEANVTYSFPQSWPSFTFYGQAYAQITADTNGNIWFGTPGTSNSFVLSTTGPVISAWNNDLSSYFNGGVFVQHKTDLPQGERVVIEWQTETYTDAGTTLPNNFEVVLFKNGDIRIDYKSFNVTNATDFGSGISNNDNSHNLSITNSYFPVYQLAGNSYGFTTHLSSLQVNFAGTGGGSVTSSPAGIACNTNCSSMFSTGDQITLSPNPDQYSLFKGWSTCTGLADCVFTLGADTTVTATFDLAATQLSGTFYQSVQDAYNNAQTGDAIYAWDVTFNGGLICDQSRDVMIEGGYDKIYGSIIGTTRLTNPLIISAGSVRVNNLAIVGDSTLPDAPISISNVAIETVNQITTPVSGPALISNKGGKKHKKKKKDDDHDD